MGEVFEFTVNGQVQRTEEDKPLLRYLRDDLKLYSVKDGCSEGACGTCTIVVDGKAIKSCVLTTKRAVGRNILTVEGLSDEWKDAFVYAFGAVGAVQCGFCIPGMVMAGTALLQNNLNPTEEDVKYALRGNICRCTGYKKIIEGILLTAKILRGEASVDENLEKGDLYGVGQRAFRVDVRKKVLGFGKYPDDIELDGMAYVSAVRSKYPRARVLKIDASKAEALPGVLGVLTAADVPNNKVGHIQQDWDVMIAEGDITRCVGDAICLVVAETEDILNKAKKLVKIDYEELEPVRGIAEAKREDAPKVHSKGNLCQTRHVVRGDAAKALAESKYTVTNSFRTPFTEHAFLEPECAVAFPYKDGVKILSTDQGAFDTRKETAIMFGWDPERVVVENQLIGGGFGGKEDVSVQHIAALAAWKYQVPVKAKFSRQESLYFHPKRHAMEGTFTLGCDENGIFTGLDCEINFDTGAYASLCGPVLERACTHSVGPYCYQNTDIRGYGYYTNNPPAGAFRGFGVCQSEFALESLINVLAEKVGITPWEIRYRNAIEPGKVLPNGQIADCSTALKETLEAVKEVYEQNMDHAGIACAMKNAGVGVGIPDTGRVKLIVEEDEKLHIFTGASCIGQGLGTVLVQMIVTNTDLSHDDIVYERSNTWISPDSGTTSGSRQTLVTGEACRRACEKFMEAKNSGKSMKDMIGETFYGEYLAKTHPLGADVPNPISHVAYGYATQVCILDPKTGKIEKMIAAHDVGKAVNPLSCEGQIEGGVVMSMGFALREQYPIDENCKPIDKYGSLGLFRSHEVPEIEAIVIDKPGLDVACGAIGIGEITSIPTAPAIADAYCRFDGERRYSLPLSNTPYERKK